MGRRVHPQNDVEVAEAIVGPADTHVSVGLRVGDQLVETGVCVGQSEIRIDPEGRRVTEQVTTTAYGRPAWMR